MKKLVFLFGILFALQTALFAQDTTVVFNAHLLSTFQLNVVDGNIQEIIFDEPLDYNVGVYGPHDIGMNQGILPGWSTVTVEATENWYFTIEAVDFIPGGGPDPGAPGSAIPITNLGVWCDEEPTAIHSLSGECSCLYLAPDDALGITAAPVTLIGNGTGNAGTIDDNIFWLNWMMGTMLGSMNTNTMLAQLTGSVPGVSFTTGDYTTTAYLTLHPAP